MSQKLASFRRRGALRFSIGVLGLALLLPAFISKITKPEQVYADGAGACIVATQDSYDKLIADYSDTYSADLVSGKSQVFLKTPAEALATDSVCMPDVVLKDLIIPGATMADSVTVADMEALPSIFYNSSGHTGLSSLIGIEYAQQISFLGIFSQNLSDITPIASLAHLVNLHLEQNQIFDITPLSGLNLFNLYLSDNQISDITALSGMTNLQILELNFNEISDISPLAELNNLYSVDLDNNQISSIAPLAELINLNSLTLNSNQISDIALLAGLPSLEMLDLNDNQITDVAPLAGLLNLTYLNLAGNEITDVAPLAGLSNLVELYIGGNHIADISPLRAVHQAIINSGYPQASFNASYQRIFFDVTSQSATVNNPLRQFDNTGIVPDTVQDQYASYDSGANQFKLFNLPELTSTEVALFALNCAQRPGQDPSMTVCFSGQLFARHSAPTVGTPTSGTPTAGAPKSGASSADYGAVALSVATLGFGAITLAIIKQRKLNFKR